MTPTVLNQWSVDDGKCIYKVDMEMLQKLNNTEIASQTLYSMEINNDLNH
jgi:hypothetical protein